MKTVITALMTFVCTLAIGQNRYTITESYFHKTGTNFDYYTNRVEISEDSLKIGNEAYKYDRYELDKNDDKVVRFFYYDDYTEIVLTSHKNMIVDIIENPAVGSKLVHVVVEEDYKKPKLPKFLRPKKA